MKSIFAAIGLTALLFGASYVQQQARADLCDMLIIQRGLDSLGSFPNVRYVAFNPLTNLVYVTISDTDENIVMVFNGLTMLNVANITVGNNPYGIGVNPMTSRAYVANQDGETISIINTLTNQVIETIDISEFGTPDRVRVNPATNKAYVQLAYNAGGILVINGTNDIEAIIPTESEGGFDGIYQGDMEIDMTNNLLYIRELNLGDPRIVVANLTNNSIIANMSSGSGLEYLALDVGEDLLYASAGNTIEVYDTNTFDLIDEISTSDGDPETDDTVLDIAIDTSANRMFAVIYASDRIDVINTADYDIEESLTYDSGEVPFEIVADSMTNRAYVTMQGANYISQIITGPCL